jgi:hypothetical protein
MRSIIDIIKQLQIVILNTVEINKQHPVERFSKPIYYYLFLIACALIGYALILHGYISQLQDGEVKASTEKAFWICTILLPIGLIFFCKELASRRGRKWLFSITLRSNKK